VDYEAYVAADAHRAEVVILRHVDLVKLEPRMRRIHLQIEGSGLCRLLLVAGQLVEAAGESIRDEEVHLLSEVLLQVPAS
jgi:hypothetical protein